MAYRTGKTIRSEEKVADTRFVLRVADIPRFAYRATRSIFAYHSRYTHRATRSRYAYVAVRLLRAVRH